MRTGRPAKASTIYKVSIHNNGGRRYASTQPYTVDENGKKHYTHKHWGIVDDDMRFHPNSTYFYASLEERRKLIFPSDWDLSEIKALSGTGHRGADPCIVHQTYPRHETRTDEGLSVDGVHTGGDADHPLH